MATASNDRARAEWDRSARHRSWSTTTTTATATPCASATPTSADSFHDYDFHLLRRFETDPCAQWGPLNTFLQNVDRDPEAKVNFDFDWVRWYLLAALDTPEKRHKWRRFVTEHCNEHMSTKDQDQSSFLPTPCPPPNLVNDFVRGLDIAELHLDQVVGGIDTSTELPGRLAGLFRHTPNVRLLSLMANGLTSLPADVGRLHRLEELILTNNKLQSDGSSLPYTLTFCRRLHTLKLDHNLLDALPGFLLDMKTLCNVYRHGNHNYFKSTFMWYHTDVGDGDRILACPVDAEATSEATQKARNPDSLQDLSIQAVISSRLCFFGRTRFPDKLKNAIADQIPQFMVCGNCPAVRMKGTGGFKVFTFKNPYLGNTCVPFLHWACSYPCARAIEVPARNEQLRSAREEDQRYREYVEQSVLSLYLPLDYGEVWGIDLGGMETAHPPPPPPPPPPPSSSGLLSCVVM